MVFGKAHSRIADGADDLGVEVALPADVIEQFTALRVVEQAVDGKVAARGIGAGVGWLDGCGTAAIAVRAVAAKARYLIVALVEHYQRDTKLRTHRHRVLKERSHLFWSRIRNYIPVLGRAPQRQVAHATTG